MAGLYKNTDKPRPGAGMTLRELWDAQRVPLVSGIYFASGDVVTLLEQRASAGHAALVRGDILRLDDVAAGAGFSYASIDPLFEAPCRLGATRADLACGEGSYGGDGFVCLLENGAPRWLAFLTFSNPFVEARVDGEYLLATNNRDETWRFPLASPQGVQVAPTPWAHRSGGTAD